MAKRLPNDEDMDKALRARSVSRKPAIRWLAATDRRLVVRGLAWFKENQGTFARLPLRAKGIVRPGVWNLGLRPASARIAFRSNTSSLAVRVRNLDTIVMPHMTASASNGLQLYCGEPMKMRPWSVAIPSMAEPEFTAQMFEGIPSKMREYRLYLPLYRPLESLHLGFSKGARIAPPSPNSLAKPVVFYGSSITQGGCASTAGGDYVSSVGRRLNLEVINLGFSGNGKGDAEMAELMGEIDAALYVLDYSPNVTVTQLRRTLPRFVRILRERRPNSPILLLTIQLQATYDYNLKARGHLEAKRDVMIGFYVQQRRKGFVNIHLVDGFGLLPFGGESLYADTTHLTEHGFNMMAERLAPAIEQILMLSA